ncbi:MAG: hypothetical protein JJD93_14735 [Ilumatobacteraceae bacterium]|nr:hypothetical protein [Ilumatobacteraceae bacterium]
MSNFAPEEETEMSMYGANPEQLNGLGRSMKQQRTAIDGVIAAVSSALAGTVWEGPARQQFESEWNTSFKSALNRLNEAFEVAGTDCINRSADLQRVMGAR